MVLHGKAELLAALVSTGFGSFVVYKALGLPYVSEFGPGPGFFPLWIGIGIVACSLFMLFAYFLRGDTSNDEIAKVSAQGTARSLGAWLAFVVAIALLSLVGFAISFGLLTAFLILVLDRRSSRVALGVALGLALSFYLVFAAALGVSLPVGPWGF